MDTQQMDRLYDLIKENSDAETKNERLLKMINLLLEEVDYSDKSLRGYSDKALLLLFSAYNKAAGYCYSFYDASNGFLNPAKKAGEFGQKIEASIARLKQVSEDIMQMENAEKDLLEQEAKLAERQKDYEELQEKIKQLRLLQNAASPEKMREELRIVADETERIKAEYERYLKEYNNHLGENSAILKSLKGLNIANISQLLFEPESIKIKLDDYLSRFDELLRHIININESERDRIRALTGHSV